MIYILYNLNYNYSSFRGTLYRPHHSLSCAQEWRQPGYILIYGDDVLLYESPKVTLDTYDTAEIDIDVHGVRNLKIEFKGGVWYDGNWAEAKICLAECVLQK